MPTDRDMPASWSANARRGQAPMGAAVERAREVRAGAAAAPARFDELASRRAARRAAEEARRKATTFTPPTGPQAC